MTKVETVWDQQVLLPTAFSPLLSLHWRSKDVPTFEIPKKVGKQQKEQPNYEPAANMCKMIFCFRGVEVQHFQSFFKPFPAHVQRFSETSTVELERREYLGCISADEA